MITGTQSAGSQSAAHTPGPWSVNDWPQANADIHIGASGTPRIAAIILRFVSINEQAANARLIAAAPTMLAALRGMLAANPYGDADQYNAAVDAMAAAVAKAEGR